MGTTPHEPAPPFNILFFKNDCAPESFLYFKAIDSKLGPTIFLLIAWQPKQAFFFATENAF